MKDEIEKKYWSIGEVSDKLDVPAFNIRFWEDKLKLAVKRSHGKRMFQEKDIAILEVVKGLRYTRHFQMDGVKQELKIMGLL